MGADRQRTHASSYFLREYRPGYDHFESESAMKARFQIAMRTLSKLASINDNGKFSGRGFSRFLQENNWMHEILI